MANSPMTVVAAMAVLAAAASAQSIPIKPGVVLTFATQPIDSTQRFDFEREITVQSLTPDEWHLRDEATNQLKPSNKIGTIRVDRTVSHREATLAREIWLGNISPDVDQHRGSSWLAASNAVMKQLRADGEADVTVGSTAFTGQGTLRRVEPGPVTISVLVNGHPETFTTMHTRIELTPQLLQVAGGSGFGGITYDFWFIDDTSTAWIVRQTGITKWTDHSHPQDRQGLQELVRVQWSDSSTTLAMAQALSKTCRVPVYGIHFATASAELTPSSGPTLQSIADLLAKQPTWQVTIEGHTDSVGGAAYNKDLSERRAAAVKTALVTSYNVPADRLSTTGYGLSRPVETNATLAGRAHNRRVELARKC
jgi:outer membrane protein OmpA-like peptidoglycan-associated protein